MVLPGDSAGVKLFPPTFEPWRCSRPDRSVAVLMSGGVDSSVTALLLKEAGWDVVGITMKVPMPAGCEVRRPCCGADAAFVCRQIGAAHYFVDVQEAFERLIIEPFRRSYFLGRTPNPCIDCNTFLKFRLLWDFLREEIGVEYLATGHYARIVRDSGRVRLARAADRSRDQSYFLYGIAADRLEMLLLPLGEWRKTDVRAFARARGLPVADKPDSAELCFAGEGDYRHALGTATGPSRGNIVDVGGRVIGQHDGIFNYTVGQRRGLRIAAGKPLYVARICPQTNTVVVGTREQVSRRTVRASGVNVLVPEELRIGARLYGKIRSYGEPAACEVVHFDGREVVVQFDEPQFAPTPGQHLVLYDACDAVVAGGVICASREPARCAIKTAVVSTRS